MLELLFVCMESIRCQSSGTSGNWRACCFNVVVTSCHTGVSGEQTCVSAGKSVSRARYGSLVSLGQMGRLGERT